MWTIRNVLIIRKHGSSSTHRLFGQWHGETRCYKCLVLLPNQSDSVVLKGISLISQGQHPSQDASGNMEKWWRWGAVMRRNDISHWLTLPQRESSQFTNSVQRWEKAEESWIAVMVLCAGTWCNAFPLNCISLFSIITSGQEHKGKQQERRTSAKARCRIISRCSIQ